MSSIATTAEMLKEALQKTGHDWLLRFWGEDAERNLKRHATELDKFVREYQGRFEDRPDPFGLVEVNPTKAAAFFHPDTLLASPTMKILIWRLLIGGEIEGIDFHYEMDKRTSLEIRITSVFGQEEAYKSESPSDFRALRHFGILGEGKDTTIQGYYAFSRSH